MLCLEILAIFVGIIVYVSLGNLYITWWNYAFYYPRSWAAKILTPIPLFDDDSPFLKGCPEIDESRRQKYGSFEEYNRRAFGDHSGGGFDFWSPRIIWPLLFLVVHFICICAWIAYIFWTIGCTFGRAFCFVFSGRMLKKIGLLPK